MRLKHETPWPHNEVGCFACQHAGENLEIWGTQVHRPYIYNTGGTGVLGGAWRIFYRDLDTGKGYRKRSARFCNFHWPMLHAEWEHIGQLEVDLARAIDSYEQRDL